MYTAENTQVSLLLMRLYSGVLSHLIHISKSPPMPHGLNPDIKYPHRQEVWLMGERGLEQVRTRAEKLKLERCDWEMANGFAGRIEMVRLV